MKKFTKIGLHKLSQAELAEKEQMLLNGGSNACACAGACMGEACACFESEDRSFQSSDSNASIRSSGNSESEATKDGFVNKYL